MHSPELLVLDEPTSGLDPFLQQEFVDLVQAAKTAGRDRLHVLARDERGAADRRPGGDHPGRQADHGGERGVACGSMPSARVTAHPGRRRSTRRDFARAARRSATSPWPTGRIRGRLAGHTDELVKAAGPAHRGRPALRGTRPGGDLLQLLRARGGRQCCCVTSSPRLDLGRPPVVARLDPGDRRGGPDVRGVLADRATRRRCSKALAAYPSGRAGRVQLHRHVLRLRVTWAAPSTACSCRCWSSVFTIAGGARSVAGDENAGTLDLVLAHPVSRRSLALQRFAATAGGIVPGRPRCSFAVDGRDARRPAQLTASTGGFLGASTLQLALFGAGSARWPSRSARPPAAGGWPWARAPAWPSWPTWPNSVFPQVEALELDPGHLALPLVPGWRAAHQRRPGRRCRGAGDHHCGPGHGRDPAVHPA